MAQQDSSGQRLRDTPCIQSLLGFFFNKGVRGGPKIFLNLAATLFALLLVIKLMPQRMSDSALNSIPHDLWTGVAEEVPLEDDDSTPGGLRIVVFGENDIGTPIGEDEEFEGAKSWTEALCAQLQCSKHVSMTPSPDAPAWSVSSKALYAHGVERVLNETSETSSPGMDYSYLSTYYAPKWQTLDLKDQVDRFLAMPKPRHAPKETLWVFNFGFWDVWSLSAMPIPAGKEAVDAMTKDIFEQIERLYEASTDVRSAAWSDASYVSAPLESGSSPEAESEEPSAGGPTEKREESAENGSQVENNAMDTAEYFRLLIPRVTDPSLLPGWRDLRAQLPKVHSKAEQMRNSAALTEHWNDRIVDGLVEWVRKENKKPGEGEENKETKRSDPETAPSSSPLAENADVQTTTQGKKVGGAPTQQERPRPSPIRDGFAYNLANYVLDAMVERQLRNAKQHDGSGRGDGAVEDGFRDVTNSCVERVDTAMVAVSVQSGVRLEIPNKDIGGDIQVPSATTPEKQQQQHQAGDRRSSSKRNEEEKTKKSQADAAEGNSSDLSPNKVADTVKVCQIPSDYLFYTPFALSQKAIADIAAQTADMIRNNETIRGKLQAQMEQNKGP
ncbi:hypothetical protein J7T55_006645 [Diaporthe amygdali]|uniref:uncharacterized protein n=1 Tax=Phomopsis amygdali TaxID=1214568 RepID=UPI0022FE0858|nr:uncharacterized protein J7T55_006645 [Diaporthe amygdali]KAJ0125300.1 hypothetical protein J7T55_006645 [Diaporthe amygdali]